MLRSIIWSSTPLERKAAGYSVKSFDETALTDLLHKIVRHTLAHHRRETIAFARRINAAMERLFVTAVWRNFVKKRSERKVCASTPAMYLGLSESRWNWKRVLSRRLFHDRIALPRDWQQLYCRDWTTPLLVSNARHRLLRAF